MKNKKNLILSSEEKYVLSYIKSGHNQHSCDCKMSETEFNLYADLLAEKGLLKSNSTSTHGRKKEITFSSYVLTDEAFKLLMHN